MCLVRNDLQNRLQRYTCHRRACKRLSGASALPERHLRSAADKPAVDRSASRRYTCEMHHRIASLTVILATLAGLSAAPARAGDVTPEVWMGGGVSYPDYHNVSETMGRGGIGAGFANHIPGGARGQVSRAHFHSFADAGVILPGVWFLVPSGRYQFGRREDRSENAWGWCAGLRLVGDSISFYVEANEILEPQFNKGLSLGI